MVGLNFLYMVSIVIIHYLSDLKDGGLDGWRKLFVYSRVACRCNNTSEESTNQAETDAAGDVPNTTRTENNREKQSTQYLTRFGNVPTSSGQEREILLIQ